METPSITTDLFKDVLNQYECVELECGRLWFIQEGDTIYIANAEAESKQFLHHMADWAVSRDAKKIKTMTNRKALLLAYQDAVALHPRAINLQVTGYMVEVDLD